MGDRKATCRGCFRPIYEVSNPRHDPRLADSDVRHWVHEDGKHACGQRFWGDSQANPVVVMGPYD